MRVQFVDRTNGPDALVCEAEVIFDEPGPLWNIKLVGFALWRSPDGEVYVTFPSRAFGVGPERRYFDYLRAADGDAANTKNVKSWILAAYGRREVAEIPPLAPAPVRSRSRRTKGEAVS